MKNWAKISDYIMHTLKVISWSITWNIWTKIGPVGLYILLYKITTKRIVKNTYFCLFLALKRCRQDLVVIISLETDSPSGPPGDTTIAWLIFPPQILHRPP